MANRNSQESGKYYYSTMLMRRKYCFSIRVVNMWNSFPNYVVSADATNVFKNRLDKFWHDQEIICDFKAQLEVADSRGESIEFAMPLYQG